MISRNVIPSQTNRHAFLASSRDYGTVVSDSKEIRRRGTTFRVLWFGEVGALDQTERFRRDDINALAKIASMMVTSIT